MTDKMSHCHSHCYQVCHSVTVVQCSRKQSIAQNVSPTRNEPLQCDCKCPIMYCVLVLTSSYMAYTFQRCDIVDCCIQVPALMNMSFCPVTHFGLQYHANNAIYLHLMLKV